MGTDIHAVAQVKRDGKWETIKVKNHDYVEGSTWPWEKGEFTYRAFPNRWYALFSVLANVRNGRGFAGVVTGTGFVPITDGRGFPNDFEVDDNGGHCGVWMGDHSKTWMTLAEINAHDWSLTTRFAGGDHDTVYADVFKDFLGKQLEEFRRYDPEYVRFVMGFDS